MSWQAASMLFVAFIGLTMQIGIISLLLVVRRSVFFGGSGERFRPLVIQFIAGGSVTGWPFAARRAAAATAAASAAFPLLAVVAWPKSLRLRSRRPLLIRLVIRACGKIQILITIVIEIDLFARGFNVFVERRRGDVAALATSAAAPPAAAAAAFALVS
jgi:hypothetical protein